LKSEESLYKQVVKCLKSFFLKWKIRCKQFFDETWQRHEVFEEWLWLPGNNGWARASPFVSAATPLIYTAGRWDNACSRSSREHTVW